MKTLAKDTWQIACQNWKNILLFELLYRMVTMPAYLRLISRGVRLALEKAGYSYLTAGNIGGFFLCPWTILILIGIVAVGMLLVVLEIAGLITAFQGSAYYQKLTPLHILWGGMEKTATEIWKKNWKLAVTTSVQVLIMNLFFLARILTHTKPLNFVMKEIVNEPWAAIFLAVVLIVIMIAVYPAMFVPYGCMVEQKSFSDSLHRSHVLTRHRKRFVAGLMILCEIGVCAVTVLAYLVGVAIAAVLVNLYADQTLAMAVLLRVADRIELAVLFAGSILAVVGCYAALSVCYYQYGTRHLHEERWDFRYPARGTPKRRRIVMVMAILAAVGVFSIWDMVRTGPTVTDRLLTQVEITAHRGSSQSAPENTMASIQTAMEEMADTAEIDVQLSSDGVVVLGHDASLKRVAGVNRPISSMTWEQLRKLDVGSWFSEAYAGERIPSLQEVLEACRGKIHLNIEIKNVGADSDLPARVVSLIQNAGMEEQCVVTSTSLSYLKAVKEIAPEILTGYVISAAYGNFYSSDALDFISLRSSFVDKRLVENIHAQGKGIFAWTVNSKSEMERLMMLGVDGIITDRPVLAREIVYREESTETLFEYLRMVFR